jgi:hypothetical protein
MQKNLFLIVFFITLTFNFTNAQDYFKFFPHSVGNRWDYDYWNGSFIEFYSTLLTRDSTGNDGSKYLFYDNENQPRYKVDTAYNVFQLPYILENNYLIYKLQADSGEAWFNPSIPEWCWVAWVDTVFIFSQLTAIKSFQYGPVHPDSVPEPYILRERRLAYGFGLIYEWEEPGYFYTIKGCIIESDTFGTITSVKPPSQFPSEFVLMQNYPNPFNPTTTIEFEIPISGYATVNIYNILGQKIKNLFDGWLRRGNHKFVWNAISFTSGIYICRLNVNGINRTIKMLLTK